MATSTGGVWLPPGQPQNWFARHWKWAVPTGCLGLLALLAVFVGAIFSLVEYSFQHSDVYIHAISQAKTNPMVVEKIGQPLEIGWFATGNINISGPSGNADLAIPMSGPRGEGTIYAVAKKSAGIWRYETLQVEVAGEAARIDLLPQEQIVPVER
jgi:hypothetical protein